MIEIKNVSKKYGETVILENTSYDFPKKGIVCLMGASGSGKTTLLNLLAGFDTDYDGEILACKTSINKMSIDELCSYRKNNVGFVFQNYNLLFGYTVLENVMLASTLSNEAQEVSLEKSKNLLSRLGISEKENQKAENLSGGQKQRTAIARALMSNPQILFADEPTGSLDRKTSIEIMELLREVSKTRLVIVITHDQKICEFADEIIHIKDKKIINEKTIERENENEISLNVSPSAKISSFSLGAKNFKVHFKRYIAVSLAISIGILAFLFSLSFGNVISQSIEDFKEKNTAFNNGYIKGTDNGTIFNFLNNDKRIENIYYQYKLHEISLSIFDKTEIISEKFPSPKTSEGVSYGAMPKRLKNEISLTPSLAKKFSENIEGLIGKELVLNFDNKEYTLTISGIYNKIYDDFILSSDIEQKLYENLKNEKNFSISYDVKNFEDIVAVSNNLKLRGISSVNASAEVYALQKTFKSLNKLFLIISIIILIIFVFICAMLLFKLQNTRYHEIGLLSALGFKRTQITAITNAESILLAGFATVINLFLLLFSLIISKLLSLPLIITGTQIFLSVVASFVVLMLLSLASSYKLVHTEPAAALKK